MLKNNPDVFLTQREAYWYLQGIKDSRKHHDMLFEQDIQRYSMEYMDHLPEGDVEHNKVLPEGAGKGKVIIDLLQNWGIPEEDWNTFLKENVISEKEVKQ